MDRTHITTAITTLKSLKECLQTLAGLTLKMQVIGESQADFPNIQDALNKLSLLQDALFHTREQLVKLQEENSRLQEEIRRREDREDSRIQYNLRQTPGGAVVYESVSQAPKHYMCPSCMNNRQLHILQRVNTRSGQFECPNCRVTYRVEQSQKVKYGRQQRRRRLPATHSQSG